MQTAFRTHTCGALRAEHAGETIVLSGWVDRRRDYGKLAFIDLRDRYGKVQVVCAQDEEESEALATLRTLRHEDVVRVRGTVRPRDEAQRNPKLKTGDVEVHAERIEVLNRSRTPPFEVNAPSEEGDEVALETRLRYRPLDLRRPAMQRRLQLRHRVLRALHAFFDRAGFLEVETPILTRATPEGARDYLVPSRVTQGSFYALPQSPQLFKQLLMVGGYDRYYQIARCFRDEDLRADRQPEFTQLDLEMSFVDEEDVYRVLEGCLQHVWREVLGRELAAPFPRIPYDEAMLRYGIDKPDLRFGLEIRDVTELARRTEAAFLRDPASEPAGPGKKGGAARAIRVPGAASRLSRKMLDKLPDVVRPAGAKGVAWLKVQEGNALKGSVRRFFEGPLGEDLVSTLEAGPGDLLLIVADRNADVAAQAAGLLRLHLGRTLELIDRSVDRPVWITGFPYFEHDPETETYIACRHPFTQPSAEDVEELEKDPRKVHARAYDLVLNGVELGSGSIRNHDVALQRRVLSVLGYSEAESEQRFGFLLEALEFGAPPHGGAALGLDRFAAVIQGLTNLREVVAFPKTARATCLLTGAPSTVEARQLTDLAIAVTAPGGEAGSDGPAPPPAS